MDMYLHGMPLCRHALWRVACVITEDSVLGFMLSGHHFKILFIFSHRLEAGSYDQGVSRFGLRPPSGLADSCLFALWPHDYYGFFMPSVLHLLILALVSFSDLLVHLK